MPKPSRIFPLAFPINPSQPFRTHLKRRFAMPPTITIPAKIFFQVTCKETNVGDTVWVVGSVPEHLGLGWGGCLCQRWGGFGALEK